MQLRFWVGRGDYYASQMNTDVGALLQRRYAVVLSWIELRWSGFQVDMADKVCRIVGLSLLGYTWAFVPDVALRAHDMDCTGAWLACGQRRGEGDTLWRSPAGVTVVYSEGGAFVRCHSCRNR